MFFCSSFIKVCFLYLGNRYNIHCVFFRTLGQNAHYNTMWFLTGSLWIRRVVVQMQCLPKDLGGIITESKHVSQHVRILGIYFAVPFLLF